MNHTGNLAPAALREVAKEKPVAVWLPYEARVGQCFGACPCLW
jgi:hypothetical protein